MILQVGLGDDYLIGFLGSEGDGGVPGMEPFRKGTDHGIIENPFREA